MNTVGQIFTGKNGTAIAGITAITMIVLFDKIIDGQYKFSGKKGDDVFTFEPAGRACEENQPMEISKEETE
jgi:hypothetical protein